MSSIFSEIDRYTEFARSIWGIEEMRVPLALIVGGMLLSMLLASRRAKRDTREQTKGIRRARNNSIWRRLWWSVRRPHDLMAVDGLVVERVQKRAHAVWIGPTGGGKSSAIAEVRCDGKRAMLVVTPDLSDPLRAKADFVWTACESRVPVDFLIGTPGDVAMRLTEVFRSGGSGVWKMAAREAATQVIAALDAAGQPRTLEAIGRGVEALADSNRRLKMACEGWVTRFLSTALAMDGSVGAGGVDIAELLRQGQMVVLDNDIWKQPGLGGDVVAFGLAEAKRVADLVPGGFRLVFEEAGQLGERIDLADPFFRAGRRRKIAVDALMQSETDLNDAIATSTATWVYFRPQKPEHRTKVAKALDLTEKQIDEIPDFHAWIEHDGKIRRLVHFPKPSVSPVADGISANSQVEETGGTHRWEIIQVPRWKGTGEPVTYEEPWRDGPLALPAPSIRHEKLLAGSYQDGTHLRWNERHDKDGYGEIWIPGEGYRKVHRIAYELAYGAIPRNPDGTTMTVQHEPECPKDCFRLEHLSLLTRSANSRDSHTSMRRKIRGGRGGKRPRHQPFDGLQK